MSDKGFGDHINRGVVKNPLLSSAVTGLSIEDLTHNTVLIPAVPSQELITRQDKQCGPQTATLANTTQNISNFPSGDANSNPLPHNLFTNVNSNTSHVKKDSHNNEIKETTTTSTQSKASAKADDDFDVNEYFARLQGSRYVSAPLSSIMKEDQNANLQAVEEHLEEINLNEPEKVTEDVQHSLTADIAQNFSQLPTVLPQVASAVFSSFSNMLSMKSRDAPDVGHVYRGEDSVPPGLPLGVPDAPKSVAPPPLKEPPAVGTGNYRITTKKKVYAQIPGLTGEAQIIQYNPTQQTAYTTPQNIYSPQTEQGIQLGYTTDAQNTPHSAAQAVNQSPYFVPETLTSSDNNIDIHKQDTNAEKKESVYNFFSPVSDTKSSQELQFETVQPKTEGVVPQTIQSTANANQNFEPDASMTFKPIQSTTAQIIPPPPMFSNVPRGDGQASVERTILPPSVARRISAKQPTTNPQTPPMNVQGNIFVPTFDTSQEYNSNVQPETQLSQGNVSTLNFNSSNDAKLPPSSLFQTHKTISGTESVPPLSSSLDMHMESKTYIAPPQQGTFMQTNVSQKNWPGTLNIQQAPNLAYPQSTLSEATVPSEPKSESGRIVPQVSHSIATFSSNSTPSYPPSIQPQKAETQEHASSLIPQSLAVANPSLSVLNEPPPLFYDPTKMSQQKPELEKTLPPTAPSNVNQYFNQNPTSSEPPKTVIEPPKMTGNLNLRMTKKRPQYYSGPIEGIGSISNNIKPTLNPVQSNSFQGALFTPSQEITQDVADTQRNIPNNPSVDASTLYDSANVASPYSHPSIQPLQPFQTNYNTVFDLSRPTTEIYEQSPPKLDPEPAKGFGLLGSLKSKLGSIDINKIQNTVTTFFDPAYNESKGETIYKQETAYAPQTYGNDYSKDSTTFDIFVGDYNRMQPSNYPANYYSSEFQNANFNVQESMNEHKDVKQSVMDIAWRDTSSAYIEQSDVHHPSYSQANLNTVGSTIGSGISSLKTTTETHTTFKNDFNNYATLDYSNVTTTNSQATAPYMAENLVKKNSVPMLSSVPNINNPLSLFSAPFVTTEPTPLDDKIVESVTNLVLNSTPQPSDDIQTGYPETIENPISELLTNPPIENTFKLFDSHPLLPSDENVVSEKTFIIKDEIDPDYDITTQNLYDSFEDSPIHDVKTSTVENNFNILHSDVSKDTKGNDTLFKYFEKPTSGSSAHLFEFSSLTTNMPPNVQTFDELSAVKNKLESLALHESQNILSEPAQEYANVDEDVSELNICVTCREVAKPDDREEVEDLTTQLIENITAPIQLLNPVGAVLPESEHGQEVGQTSTIDPLSDIAHITEEVIDEIPIHTVAELLNDVNIDGTIPNYGWNTADINDILNTNALVEHDYNLHPDPNAIGFLQNKPLFFENIPNNASDEIKAEFKHSHEEPAVIPRPINIPAAPEEDNKSDESGLDVLSIEQDAKKDFPIYDDFVIEPSETDDDKIECMEREKSTEEFVSEVDTFTNRVERFKQMETVETDDVFEAQAVITTPPAIPSTTSPAITIASYFDTGNYAVENHYRNSLTSPTGLQSYASLPTTMRIPPGFEKEYQRRLSGISKDVLPDTFHEQQKQVPDTTTQTRVSPTVTFTQPPVTHSNVTHICSATMKPTLAIETILTKPIEEPILADVERLPAFSSLTGQTVEVKEENVSKITNTPKAEDQSLPDPMNFFASDASASNKDDDYNNYSRLSSYFASPPKSDTAKSFFELSQSQNHYRHSAVENSVRNFFNPKTNDTHNDSHETQNRYRTNMDLIRDLANYKDPSPKDDVVRTVNYFTVEFDINKSNDTIGEPSAAVKITDKDVNRIQGDSNSRNDDQNEIVRKCKNCCNPSAGRLVDLNLDCVDCKFRKCMDISEGRKEEVNMDDVKSDRLNQRLTVNFMEQHLREESDDGVAILSESRATTEYSPVKHHWFYRVDKDGNSIWRGFSVADSMALENAFNSPELTDETLVATDGGRYDVNVKGRLRMPVYWSEKPSNVRRCSWFYKGNTDARYVPYTEPVAEQLEEEYRHGVTTGEWHRRLMLPNSELVVMHGPAVMVHFLQTGDSFSSSPSAMRPRVVRRGCVESEIEDAEPTRADHLLLLCHGVGSACDMRMRAVEAVVNDFRTTSLQLLQSHYKNSYDSGLVGRIEVLPISWHGRLHSSETGVDARLANVTLDSIPWLRGFANDTLLDVLFYTSPVFCQTIIDTVCSEMNRIYHLFKKRNPDFDGGVSLGGHSLGSVILYDLLGHQAPEMSSENVTEKSYVEGYAGTGQPMVKYPKLDFHPDMLFALGSPIAIFECIRGVELLGEQFCLPTCKNFFNIFHPYDPIAYRLEPMINPVLKDVKPYLIPHHKGRKRMHLELKDTMTRFGADIKQKLIESIKSTWSSMWKTQPPSSDQLEKVVEEEMEKEELAEECKEEVGEEPQATPEMLGRLNDGRRVDYVLQEAPFEMINEYLFAMTSHVCYWESEDTILLILREIYSSLRVEPDCSLPQRSLTVQRTRIASDGVTVSSSIESPSTSRGAT
ncbi:uncharacterized protein LOC119838514 [Zerene cesonia]|uniref:uncharacterized protein LOC119838514 n=1 Tax=Zerene cesonia TaxID=33412 RepID=UPI0018E553EA|nr:uncharacterized protein LOC119838514 [Zerene cesonia]